MSLCSKHTQEYVPSVIGVTWLHVVFQNKMEKKIECIFPFKVKKLNFITLWREIRR